MRPNLLIMRWWCVNVIFGVFKSLWPNFSIVWSNLGQESIVCRDRKVKIDFKKRNHFVDKLLWFMQLFHQGFRARSAECEVHKAVLVVFDLVFVLEVWGNSLDRVEAWRDIIEDVALGIAFAHARQVFHLVDSVLVHVKEVYVVLDELVGGVAVENEDEVVRADFAVLADSCKHLVQDAVLRVLLDLQQLTGWLLSSLRLNEIKVHYFIY